MLRSLQWEKKALPLVRLGALLRPCCLAAAMFLLMRAEILMRASPLAAALMAAALAAGENPAACVLGCLLGMLRLPLYTVPLLNAFSCVILLMMQLGAALWTPKNFAPGEACVSFAAGTAAMLPAMVQAGGAAQPSLQAFACGALAAAAAPFLLSALRADPLRKPLNRSEKTGALLMLGGGIAGLQALLPPLAEGLSALLTLLAGGFAPGAGVLAGLALCAGGADFMKIVSLALIALICSPGLRLNRWQKALGACAAAVLVRLAAGNGALDVRWTLCAAAAYPLLPDGLLRRAGEIAAPRREDCIDPGRIARETAADSRHRINALADAFFAMAEVDDPPDVPDEQELIQEMRARLCAGCTGYAACWAGEDNRGVRLLCRLIGDALERTGAPPGQRTLFAEGEIPPDVLRICRRGRLIPDRLGLLLRSFAQRRHSEIKRCETNRLLSLQLMQAGEILRSMAEERPPDPHWENLQAALEDAGLVGCCAAPLSRGGLVLLKNEGWTREEIHDACRALSRRLRLRLLARHSGRALQLTPAPRLSARAGASCQSGVAGISCGDSHLVHMLDDNRLLLAISDGMGSGDAAREESLLALRLLSRFLTAGISTALALETLNQQLLMRCGDEIFSTMDLCIIDLRSGIAEMHKLAACRTLILRGSEILRIEGGHLPLGILEQVQSGVSRVRLRPGDVLVMGSDGVMEADEPNFIERAARECAALPPDQLTEQLVRRAELSRENTRRDDLTCICARICAAE